MSLEAMMESVKNKLLQTDAFENGERLPIVTLPPSVYKSFPAIKKAGVSIIYTLFVVILASMETLV